MMRDGSLAKAATVLALSGVLGGSTACSTPPPDSRTIQTYLPDVASFAPAAELLDVDCGTLDCHGTAFRNLRVYGSAGLRFSPGDTPLVPVCNTAGEVSQDYLSVVGLEPELMSQVASGADPALLTMMRKARGTEAHKGGAIWSEGTDPDVCLTSWLGGRANTAACRNALVAILPGGMDNPLISCVVGP